MPHQPQSDYRRLSLIRLSGGLTNAKAEVRPC